jgi:peptidoglycan glycosyltransferase
MNRQISTVALATLVMLATLIVATTYWQTWAAPGLAARQDNSIQRVAQFEVRRGIIYASDEKTVLAKNVRVKSANGQTLYFRTYPTNGFASQVIGYSTQSRARAGLEESENDYLTGSNKDLGTFIDTLGDKLQGQTVKGNSIVLTLNVKAQKVAESSLAGKCGAAVVWNPQTGAVLAMASSPTYNPNLVEKPNGYQKILSAKSNACADASPLLNRATQGLYPPGSTFKTITAAAALDDGVYTPTSSFYDPGYCTEYGKQVYNADDQAGGHEAFGNVTLAQAYQHSINAVFCNIGKKLTSARILSEAKKFGFYTVPPLETPSDARSASGLYKGSKIYDPKDPDRFVDPGRTAFGQGQLLVTPLQMAMVAGTVANGGVMMKPYLVKKVITSNGTVVERTHSHVLRTPITPKTAAALNEMMVSVVTGGTGTEAAIPGVTVAGKTGTAETSKPGVYDAWFIFFAPAEHPTVAGAVVVQDVPGGFGGAISAPIAKAIMQAILPTTSKTNP